MGIPTNLELLVLGNSLDEMVIHELLVRLREEQLFFWERLRRLALVEHPSFLGWI